MSDDTKAHGLGWMTQDKWAATIKILSDQGVLKAAPAPEGCFTDKFLGGGA